MKEFKFKTITFKEGNFGYWDENYEYGYIRCSKCNALWEKAYNDTDCFVFCPNCGSKNK